jgi:hypothetical protein
MKKPNIFAIVFFVSCLIISSTFAAGPIRRIVHRIAYRHRPAPVQNCICTKTAHQIRLEGQRELLRVRDPSLVEEHPSLVAPRAYDPVVEKVEDVLPPVLPSLVPDTF